MWKELISFDDLQALKTEYADTMNGPNSVSELEAFKRKWIYYLCVPLAPNTRKISSDSSWSTTVRIQKLVSRRDY